MNPLRYENLPVYVGLAQLPATKITLSLLVIVGHHKFPHIFLFALLINEVKYRFRTIRIAQLLLTINCAKHIRFISISYTL